MPNNLTPHFSALRSKSLPNRSTLWQVTEPQLPHEIQWNDAVQKLATIQVSMPPR